MTRGCIKAIPEGGEPVTRFPERGGEPATWFPYQGKPGLKLVTMETPVLLAKPKPISLCLERLADEVVERFVKCTAKPGRESGLAIGLDGSIRWCDSGPVGCEIWVARDQRLVAFCPAGTPPTVLRRARRLLELPRGKPAFLRNGDELQHAGARFQVHIHGVTTEVHAPRALSGLPRVAAAAAMAMAMGANAGGCWMSAENDATEGRRYPYQFPAPGLFPVDDAGIGAPGGPVDGSPLVVTGIAGSGDWPYGPDNDAGVADDAGESDEIEIRNGPPE